MAANVDQGCTDLCIGKYTDMCADICADMCVDMCVDMRIHMCIGMCVDVYIDIRTGKKVCVTNVCKYVCV